MHETGRVSGELDRANERPNAARAARAARTPRAGKIAVALHDIEPATFERCALIRDWLDDHGVDRVTLLVIPARDLHPLGERSPKMARWLVERRDAGDCIAQHGFHHEQLQRNDRRRMIARRSLLRSAEFAGLDGSDTRRTLDAGWRLLKLAGLEPEGFVAPAYAYTPALVAELPRRFRWWAGRLHLHRRAPAREAARRRLLAPAWGISDGASRGRLLSPALIRAGGVLGGETLRLDLHPADLQSQRHMMALEWVLHRSGRVREAITYDEMIAERGVDCAP